MQVNVGRHTIKSLETADQIPFDADEAADPICDMNNQVELDKLIFRVSNKKFHVPVYNKSHQHFCGNSRGELVECETRLIICQVACIQGTRKKC